MKVVKKQNKKKVVPRRIKPRLKSVRKTERGAKKTSPKKTRASRSPRPSTSTRFFTDWPPKVEISAVPVPQITPQSASPLKGNSKTSIPVVVTFHEASPHVIRLRSFTAPLPSIDLTRLNQQQRSRALWFRYFNELSALSLALFMYWSAVRLIGWLFRLPTLALPLFELGDLPRLLPHPLRELEKLPRLSFDGQPQTVRAPFVRPVREAPVVERLPKVSIKPQIHIPEPRLFIHLRPELVTFASIAFLMMLPFLGVQTFLTLKRVEAQVKESAELGISALGEAEAAITLLDYEMASAQFSEAATSFANAQENLQSVPLVLRLIAPYVPTGQEFTSGEALITAAQDFSEAGQSLSQLASTSKGALADDGSEVFWNSLGPTLGASALQIRHGLSAIEDVRAGQGKQSNTRHVSVSG